MDDFRYIDGELHGEGISMTRLAAEVGTPCFVYSRATLEGHFDRLASAFSDLRPMICYSIKSCSNLAICRLLAERGAGMDIVSGGELHRAVHAGVDPSRCVYAGVGKTDAEIADALDAGIGWFNVESPAEFEVLAAAASARGRRCRAALRVNPDVDPKTHRYTTTGKRRTKFGVDHDLVPGFFERYAGDPWCRLTGLHLHIGSPIYTVEPYDLAIRRATGLIDALEAAGHPIEMLDIGGGFGADYESAQSPSAADYAATIVPLLRERVERGLAIVLEPGRMISANAGILLVRVLFRKQSGDKSFVICDGGMNVLLRPSHYEAFHFMWPVVPPAGMVPAARSASPEMAGLERVDVVGPICESGDFLALDRDLPPMDRGDLLAIFATGAYGMSMASRYNSMPLPPEVLVEGDAFRIVRRRETYDDLIAHEEAAIPAGARGAP